MIVLVWSLVSSVVELARRRRLAIFLRQFFGDTHSNAAMLVCRSIGGPPSTPSTSVETEGRLTRFVSEPHLHTHRVLYRNDRAEVATEAAACLIPSEWRFVSTISPLSSDEPPVFFVASIGRHRQRGELPQCTIFLESSCDRVAWNRLQPASLYSCSLERFVDVVYAFSEGCLFENNSSALVETLHTVAAPSRLAGANGTGGSLSLHASSTHIASNRPLSLLEKLFWGDGTAMDEMKQRFSSETAIHKAGAHFGSLPRRLHNSPRRRYRSCTYASARSTAKERATVTSLFCCDIPSQAARFFDPANQLPPFIRKLDHNRKLSLAGSSKQLSECTMSGRSNASSGMSPSITIDEMDRSDDGIGDIPYVDDCDIASPLPVMETSSYAALITQNTSPADAEKPPPESLDHGQSQLDQCESLEEAELMKVDGVTNAFSIEEGGNCPFHDHMIPILTGDVVSVDVNNANGHTVTGNGRTVTDSQSIVPDNEQDVRGNGSTATGNGHTVANGNGSTITGNGHTASDKKKKLPPLPPTANAPAANANEKAKANEARAVIEQAAASSRRRHSAVSQTLADSFAEFSLRHRSLSPLPHEEYYCRRSLRGSRILDGSTAADREVLRRPYTPTRRFLSSRNSNTFRAMFKPPSILVYTGGQSELYGRIRDNLTRVIPSDRYTVFNISSEALRKQPWIEPTTACLVIADTNALDDAAWAKMQSYFNQSGKIIFVCQNRLLASLTNCESSKKQADILRMAFGSRGTIAMGKEFEHFLKKSLKSLTKHGQVNETFHSKDLVGGLSYSVVLAKAKDLPLFLYMENSAHQAAAVFSDATSDELLAAGSKILPDSLSRVGVSISETEPPQLTKGVMAAQNEEMIREMMGVRYGEEIGLLPKLFLRTAQRVIEQGLPDATKQLVPVQVGLGDIDLSTYPFDFERYFARLSTNYLGRVCLHIPVTTTTMDVSSSLSDAIPTCNGAVVVAGQQVTGQGRGGNEFISPPGAAMFTFAVDLPRSSSLASNPSFIQHIFAVALCDAVHELSGVEDFPLRIKWPNDFYFNRSHKLGGMLATAKCRDDNLLVTIGAGINVSNSHPTVCLNDIVPDGCETRFHIEDVVAETLNKFQYWMNTYELKGQKEFLNEYYKYWLHSREEVLLEELGEKVMIRGLDKYGYLEVRSKNNTNKLFSVGDNGNTFDMMKGLIRHKI